MPHIRLGDEPDVRRDLIQHNSDELDEVMGLREMQAGRADLFPQECDGVQPDELRAVRDVEQQHVNDFQQHVRVVVVQIHLISAEGRPHRFVTGRRAEFCQQRESAGTDDLREVRAARDDDEVVAVTRLIAPEGLEPRAVSGDMIDHGVEHQPETLADAGGIIPIPEGRVNGAVILHGKAFV